MTVACPWCRVAMVTDRIGAVEIDRCERCGARWLDPGELGSVIRETRAKILTSWGTPSLGGDGSRWPGCPRDGQEVAGYQWVGAELGRCRLCRGVLLDAAGWEALSGAGSKQEGVSRAELGLSGVEAAIRLLGLLDS